MIENKYEVYWKYISANTFMYGTTLRFKEGVHFENKLMPSGTVIHEWLMTTQYFKDRHVPALPILKRGQDYQIEFDVEESPQNSVYFKILFYRRNTSLIDTLIIEDKTATFHFPKDAYSYKIEMMSGSVVSFHFKKIVIRPKNYELDQLFNDVIRPTTGPINMIIEEPSQFYHRIHDTAIAHLNNVVICDTLDIETIKSYVGTNPVNFIGMGVQSNQLALKLAATLNQRAFISHHGNFDGMIYSQKEDDIFVESYINQCHCLKQLKMSVLENR